MASNSKLITTATSVVVLSNGTNDVIDNISGATAFVITAGETGDDVIENFGKNDTLINYQKLQGDLALLGENGTINVDGVEAGDADHVVLLGKSDLALRYLGSKDGGHAYADASVRLAGFTEGLVTNDTFSGASGAKTFFYDNALGLNLGLDTINDFGADDLIVTTRRIYDNDQDDTIGFGNNDLLDLSGEGGPRASDAVLNPGGQIHLSGADGKILAIDFLYERSVGDVTYYYYGT